MEVESFVRAHEVRALLEATAIVRLFDAFDALIAEAEADAAAGDAIAAHCADSFRRRREALAREHQDLVGLRD
jgi:hypothetical protein